MKPLNLFLIASLFLGASGLANAEFFDPPFYSSKEINGQVVDEETGQPIEGAIIVAQWELFEPGLGDSGHRGDMMNILEVVSDKNGKYKIPAWGPKPRPLLKYLDNKAPDISVFKAGYYPGGEVLHYPRRANDTQINKGQPITIKLRRFTGQPFEDRVGNMIYKKKGDVEDYVREISILQTHSRKNHWKTMPHMIWAIEQERLRLKNSGANSSGISPLSIINPSLLYGGELYGGEEEVRKYLKQTLGVDMPVEKHEIRAVPVRPASNTSSMQGVPMPSDATDSGKAQDGRKFSIRPLPPK